MGSVPGEVNLTNVYCTLALKFKKSFTCTLLLFPPTFDYSTSGYTWARLRNHEVLKLESNEGQWFVGTDKIFQLQTFKRVQAVLFDLPVDFYTSILHNRTVYNGEGLMRSANLPLIYTIKDSI